MTWEVRCNSCGYVVASGCGLFARWEQPHGLCQSESLSIIWMYNPEILESLSKLLKGLGDPAEEK